MRSNSRSGLDNTFNSINTSKVLRNSQGAQIVDDFTSYNGDFLNNSSQSGTSGSQRARWKKRTSAQESNLLVSKADPLDDLIINPRIE